MSAANVTLEARLKERAGELGFDPVGIARLGPAATHEAFSSWLDKGYAGGMAYLERGAAKRADTRLPFAGARSAVVVALNYGGKQPAGPIARYARGDDYHDVMTERLRGLHRWLEAELGAPVAGKAYVDTGPVLERDLAQRAGLGWIGKNTMLISPGHGSFFFLGALFLDLDLQPDAPFEADRCGTCTRCLDACPTDAFVAPREMDARRCISYLTIEHRGEIDPALQPLMGELLYGCDICQDVCPWNQRFATELGDRALAARAENVAPDPRELVALTDEGFRARFRHSPIKRTKRAGLARNAAIAIANRKRG
jgi:epoxyqueuosine reductase